MYRTKYNRTILYEIKLDSMRECMLYVQYYRRAFLWMSICLYIIYLLFNHRDASLDTAARTTRLPWYQSHTMHHPSGSGYIGNIDHLRHHRTISTSNICPRRRVCNTFRRHNFYQTRSSHSSPENYSSREDREHSQRRDPRWRSWSRISPASSRPCRRRQPLPPRAAAAASPRQ